MIDRLIDLISAYEHRGKGRSPWCTEPGAVILITDGKNAFANIDPDQEPDDSDPPVGAGSAHPIHPPHVAMGVGQGDVRAKQQHQALNMNAVAEAASSAVGSELCGKPFRWDQRLFTLMIGAGGVNDEPPDLTGPAAMALKVSLTRQSRLPFFSFCKTGNVTWEVNFLFSCEKKRCPNTC